MSIKSLKSGLYSNSVITGNAVILPGDYESIATTTLTTTTATIEFTSIPATFTHLQIRGIGRTNRAAATFDSLRLRFNSDTGANYSYYYSLGLGTSASAEASANSIAIAHGCLTAINSSASIFGVAVIDILDYANTNKNKTSRALDGNNQNGSGVIEITSGNWRNTNAITSIQLTALGSFVQYSSFALYGIRG
jgi:hypothetical protein